MSGILTNFTYATGFTEHITVLLPRTLGVRSEPGGKALSFGGWEFQTPFPHPSDIALNAASAAKTRAKIIIVTLDGQWKTLGITATAPMSAENPGFVPSEVLAHSDAIAQTGLGETKSSFANIQSFGRTECLAGIRWTCR